MTMTLIQIRDAIAGESPLNTYHTMPEGNHTAGLVLEEYRLRSGYLQVACDPNLGGDPVEWIVTDTPSDEWLVG